jgi:hypothetical protein
LGVFGNYDRDASVRQTDLSSEITKKEKDSGERTHTATGIHPSNPQNPPHPDETSVRMAGRRAHSKELIATKKPGKFCRAPLFKLE